MKQITIKFNKRNERGLHCRFCLQEWFGNSDTTDLYETNPIKGIVCNICREHLENYVYVNKGCIDNATN